MCIRQDGALIQRLTIRVPETRVRWVRWTRLLIQAKHVLPVVLLIHLALDAETRQCTGR